MKVQIVKVGIFLITLSLGLIGAWKFGLQLENSETYVRTLDPTIEVPSAVPPIKRKIVCSLGPANLNRFGSLKSCECKEVED